MFEIDERPIAPQFLAKLVARHKIARFGEQQDENLEGLTRETDEHPMFAELTGSGVHLEGSEYHQRTWSMRRLRIYMSFQQFS